jgi:hypothetical protein
MINATIALERNKYSLLHVMTIDVHSLSTFIEQVYGRYYRISDREIAKSHLPYGRLYDLEKNKLDFDNLRRINKWIETGKCGDYDLICLLMQHLCNNNLIEKGRWILIANP